MLCELLRTRPVLAFDFDGTLAPIVADPSQAAMPVSTAERLWELALRLPCVIYRASSKASF